MNLSLRETFTSSLRVLRGDDYMYADSKIVIFAVPHFESCGSFISPSVNKSHKKTKSNEELILPVQPKPNVAYSCVP